MSRLNVALLWHFHQPDYGDPQTGNLALPWVRLHATKGYYDMLRVIERAGRDAQAVFNFTPSLIAQMRGYLDNSLTDTYLELSRRRPGDLTEEERRFVAANFFHANRRTMIDCYPRYGELRAMSRLPSGSVRLLADKDLADLVVWFNLTWFGYTARAEFPLVNQLIRQGRGFDEGQKLELLALQREVMSLVLPAYRRAAERGQIELTTTPFYHPILPLLCTTDSASEGLPGRPLPIPPFAAPDDARSHVRRAVQLHTTTFGEAPKGMWPAEGSVSPQALQILAEEGIQWAASDQEVLFRSIPSPTPRDLGSAYRVGDKHSQVAMVFRDRSLADGIGFRYSGMPADAAVKDVMDALRTISAMQKGSPGEPIVAVVLDGENAWEYYPDGGEAFLTRLYQSVAQSTDYRWTTISDYLSRNPPERAIGRIFPGSWIGGNFDIWIGSPEENRAWEALRDTRAALVAGQNRLTEAERGRAWEHLFVAEGSDWFWWYGDDFSTALQGEFDRLFRARLAAVHELLGVPVPAWLIKPIRKGNELAVQKPTDLVSPVIDGRSTNYYEWASAGRFDTRSADGAMARESAIVESIYFGASHRDLCLRIDWAEGSHADALQGLQVACVFPNKQGTEVLIGPFDSGDREVALRIRENGVEIPVNSPGVFGELLECAVPFLLLGAVPGSTWEFLISVRSGAIEVERWPRDGVLAFDVPADTYELEHWTV